MKAIYLALCAALLLASCGGPRRAPLAVPTPVVAPVARPLPLPPRASGDWRDAPQTAGTWTWALAGGHSTASYGSVGQPPLLTLDCDRSAASVALAVPSVAIAGPLVITTTAGTRALAATGTSTGLAATLAARDPLLDEIAFSRGRFMVETPGRAALYLPSWPEVGRVIEDCR